MRHLDEAGIKPELAHQREGEAETCKVPPLPSEDQRLFNESLLAGARSMGALIRSRKKTK